MFSMKQYLRILFVEINSTTSQGRSIQRFRLVGLPSIPVLIVVAVCAWQLANYRRTLAGYQGMYDRAQFRYTVAKMVAKLDNEGSAFVKDFLILSNASDRQTFGSCFNKSSDEILTRINETNEVLNTFTKLPYVPSEQDLQSRKSDEFSNLYNSSAFIVYMNIFRNALMNSGPTKCEDKYQLLVVTYTKAIRLSILISPNFYDEELSKVTLMYVFALQHALETHQYASSLCHLPYDYLRRGRFENANDEIDFALNASAAFNARSLTLSMDESIRRLYDLLLLNRSSPIMDELNDAANAMLWGRRPNMTFSKWYSLCRSVALFNEMFEDELSNEIKRNGFDLEWRNCVVGIIFYSLAIFVNVPAFALILMNSETTVGSLRQFSSLFQSQVDKLLEEKQKSEMLLCAMLPRSVVSQMALEMPIEAETFESSTVFFSDVVDFNETILINLKPIQVVELLNSLYGLLDSKIECFDVYKVETIGSVYMVVSGVPARNGRQHVTEVADMSLDLMASIQNEQKFRGFRGKMELRIGIHTGPCVAGVVGNKMTRYCLFGDTVNTASRMQSTGAASRIHLSESTYSELDLSNEYILDKRGSVEVKGKGTMTTYWLCGKRI